MPRRADPANESEQVRVARWRDAQRKRKRPEASAVDVALAAAVAAYVAEADERGKPGPKAVGQLLLGAAVDLLVSSGCDRNESVLKLQDRLRRADLWEVCRIARIADRRREGAVRRTPS